MSGGNGGEKKVFDLHIAVSQRKDDSPATHKSESREKTGDYLDVLMALGTIIML